MTTPTHSYSPSSSASVADTLAFIESALQPNQSILEVGCGYGELAAALSKRGFKIKAVEQNAELADRARGLGVDVETVDFLDFQSKEKFDCVAFTRSLHHIPDLDGALKKAKDLLCDDGILLLEEFGANWLEERAARWLYNLQSTLLLANIIDRRVGFGHEENSKESSLTLWRHHHFEHHKIWDSESITKAVDKLFRIKTAARVCCLYRYIADSLRPLDNAPALGRQIRQWEEQMYSDLGLEPIGLRIIATPG